MKKTTETTYQERTERNQYYFQGQAGQDKIRSLKIGIAGLGGMGSNIAEAFARLGVGELKIADPDTIDISNINRQVIANHKTVGQLKASASESELKLIAPELKLTTYTDGIQEHNIEEFVKGCDFIIDEIDVFPLDKHVILHQAARKYNIPVYSAYVVGLGINFYKFEGEEYTFDDFIGEIKNKTSEEVLETIINKFGYPLPSYLNTKKNMDDLRYRMQNTGVPIFGPATLIGHSFVVTRVITDHLNSQVLGVEVPKTPLMPNFLNIDFATMKIQQESIKK